MTDCKNCPYTDEYCASGDCNKIQANNLACNKISLTEQWKKGELPECEYYILDKEGNTSTMHLWNDERCKLSVRCKRLSILAPVPSYDEWKAKLEENAQLKELLKEWVQFEIEENPNDFTVMSERMSELANKTKEALK